MNGVFYKNNVDAFSNKLLILMRYDVIMPFYAIALFIVFQDPAGNVGDKNSDL